MTLRRALVVAALALGSAPVPAAANEHVAIAGDSIVDESRVAVRNQVQLHHPITWFATQNSGTVGKFHDKIVDETVRPHGADIVLIELGTGNAYWGTGRDLFRQQVRELLEVITPHVTCVRWFEMKPGGTRAYPGINARAAALNQILREEVNAFPNAHTVHYEAWTRLAGDDYFRADLLHLNVRGRRQLAMLFDEAANGCDPDLVSGPYWDVPDDYWAAPAIAWVAEHHLIDGYANGTYRAVIGSLQPSLDRMAWVRALWRRAGRPGPQPPPPWPDAPAGAAAPLGWAASEEIVTVPPGEPFRPRAAITRAYAVQWLYRAVRRPDASVYPDPAYPDVPPALARALRWAAGVGVVATPAGQPFHPFSPLTRAQAAAFVYGAREVGT
jgi:S-layer homology domain